MYDFVDHDVREAKTKGAGNKCKERLALEAVPVGKAVNIPKAKATRGSMQNWVWAVGKARGIRLAMSSRDGYWHVMAMER